MGNRSFQRGGGGNRDLLGMLFALLFRLDTWIIILGALILLEDGWPF